jgi:hypothetical protein
MGADNQDGQFEIKELPIVGQFNVQRFAQFSPEDAANWYVVQAKDAKKPTAMYPTMGRKHINYLGSNVLIFSSEPREIFKSVNFSYVVIGNNIFRIDSQYNQVNITAGNPLSTFAGPIYFAFLVVNTIVFSCFVDENHIYIYREDTGQFSQVTDPNSPGIFVQDGKLTKPGFIASYGNRIVVSVANSSQFFLSVTNLDGSSFNPATCFTVNGAALFAQETGIIGQMGVLNNQLYIFTSYTTGVWSNTIAIFSGTGITFPFKKNSSYDWNYGIANPTSLDIDFGRLVFLARNSDGLLQFMVSYGSDQPQVLSTKAIDTLLQKYTNEFGPSTPFLSPNSNGFLFQYENTVFYRFSGGNYTGTGILDQTIQNNSVEFNFEINDWHRLIELNGERNRIQYHVFFNFRHLVSVIGEKTIYDMSGQYYFNEIRNPDQDNPQAPDAYLAYPIRYERISPIISEKDYSEFETEYVEIDFVFGESNISFSDSPFINTKFIIAEEPLNSQPQFIVSENLDNEGQPIFVILDNSNTPSLPDRTYNNVFNPTIELYWSDDGGISFDSADVREFSQMGQYQWKMRWYQLGPSRNRVYKLICVSVVPIVVLGGTMNVRRISGGSN